MRIFTASKPRAVHKINSGERGFTLVELMVVIFIVGLASAAVVMTARPGGEGSRDEAERLAARIAALRDQSILQSRTMAVWVRPSGYGFEARSKEKWVALSEAPFAATEWRRGTKAEIGGVRQMRIAFDSTGLPSTATSIGLERGGATTKVTLSATGDVRVSR